MTTAEIENIEENVKQLKRFSQLRSREYSTGKIQILSKHTHTHTHIYIYKFVAFLRNC